MVLTLFINYLNFEGLYETWNKMLTEESIMPVRKMVLRIIELFYDKIKTNPMLNPIEYSPIIAKAMTGAEFKNAVKINIDEAEVSKIENDYKKDFSKNWASEKAVILENL
mmetsp:Transcript_16630/g.14500  ORF Transcript_16630/g.14500 Transcript_16630/m.14500 type:complete len:110 (+) Transcript_16630:901-1230(+)